MSAFTKPIDTEMWFENSSSNFFGFQRDRKSNSEFSLLSYLFKTNSSPEFQILNFKLNYNFFILFVSNF